MDYFLLVVLNQPPSDLITYHPTETLDELAFIYTYVKFVVEKELKWSCHASYTACHHSQNNAVWEAKHRLRVLPRYSLRQDLLQT